MNKRVALRQLQLQNKMIKKEGIHTIHDKELYERNKLCIDLLHKKIRLEDIIITVLRVLLGITSAVGATFICLVDSDGNWAFIGTCISIIIFMLLLALDINLQQRFDK